MNACNVFECVFANTYDLVINGDFGFAYHLGGLIQSGDNYTAIASVVSIDDISFFTLFVDLDRIGKSEIGNGRPRNKGQIALSAVLREITCSETSAHIGSSGTVDSYVTATVAVCETCFGEIGKVNDVASKEYRSQRGTVTECARINTGCSGNCNRSKTRIPCKTSGAD